MHISISKLLFQVLQPAFCAAIRDGDPLRISIGDPTGFAGTSSGMGKSDLMAV